MATSEKKKFVIIGVAVIGLVVGVASAFVFLRGGSTSTRDGAVIEMAYRAKSIEALERTRDLNLDMLEMGGMEPEVERKVREEVEMLDRIIAEKRAEAGGDAP